MAVPLSHQPLADVGTGRNTHAQAVARVLFDETPLGAQQAAALRLAGGVKIEPGAVASAVAHRAPVRRAASGEQAEQRGFTGAGLTDDAQNLARIKIEVDALATGIRPVKACQPADRQQGLIEAAGGLLQFERGVHSAASWASRRCVQ